MIVQDSAQSYTRPVSNIGVRQQLERRNAWELPGGSLLWKNIGRFSLTVCAVTIAVNLLFAGYSSHLGSLSRAVENNRHELMDANITLRAKRAAMLTPQAVELAAGKVLSLYAPKPEQKFVYNRSKGRFDRL